MAPIRKGDGTGLAGQGYSQVRKGDGTVLWNAIRDTEIFQPVSDDLTHFTGDTSDYDINSLAPAIGELSLKRDTEGNTTRIVSTSGLSDYPQSGDTLACYVFETSDEGRPGTLFGVQDASNYYSVVISNAAQELRIIKDDTIVDSEPVSLNTDEFYEQEVEWGGGSIVYRVFHVDQSDGSRGSEVGSLTHSDSDYSSGGIGFEARSGSGGPTWESYRI